MHHHASSLLQYPSELPEHDEWVIKVFDHHVASDQAQALILERQVLQIGYDETDERLMLPHGHSIRVTPHSEPSLSDQYPLGLFPPGRQDAPAATCVQPDRAAGDRF